MVAPPISPPLAPDLLAASSERLELVEQLLTIGNALSSIEDLEALLAMILTKSREITCSDAGSVFLLDQSSTGPHLIFKVAQNDSLPDLAFQETTLPLTYRSLAGYVALTGRSLNIPDAHNLVPGLPYQLDRNFDRDFAYRTCSVLVLPMQDNKNQILGVLQLINRKHRAELKITPENALDITQPYSEQEERIVRSLASQAAISIERNMLQNNIENLFESFVRASIQVIESRDPTTSGHSERVADLTVRLAQEVSTVKAGPLYNLNFNAQQIQEIRYAALLHDFGKIGVPEAILNKRHKLYPEQLEVIRQRFGVAQRSLQWQCAEQKFQYLLQHPSHCGANHSPSDALSDEHACSHCQQLEQIEQESQQALMILHHYQDLVEQLNRPEALPTKKFEALSEQMWQDLRALTQYVYVDVDGKEKTLLTAHEVEQLMLPHGNLTQSERRLIEAHVTHSYRFLKQIPWTQGLNQIPVIAYGHHEKLDGTGYPQGLKGQDIPIQTQMMAIADIYDALTAADRPYKRPLELELTVQILHEEVEKNHINGDLLSVFLEREVYRVLSQ
ncbi:MAG: HD-GYP domain-containing protein [Spirulinaceae cyanobacterium]